MTDTPEKSPDRPSEISGAKSGERIAKLLARAGVASRREVERMIEDGRVRLDGEVITTPATILAGLKGITVDGRPVRAAEATRLFLFHKPAGLITAERDPAGKPTIYTALRNALPPGTPRVMPVGRLDLSTEGLLLLTNDGELKRTLELPATGVPRTYRARTFGDITQNQLEQLMEGIEIGDIRYGSIDANMERRTGRNQWIELTLTEGKNREVRRVLEHLGLEVSRLLRTAYGPFQLGDLQRGSAWEVPQVVVERFRKTLRNGEKALAPVFAPPPEALAPKAPARTDERRALTPRPEAGARRGAARNNPAGPGEARSRATPGQARPAPPRRGPAGEPERTHRERAATPDRAPAAARTAERRPAERPARHTAERRPERPARTESAGERPADRSAEKPRTFGKPSRELMSPRELAAARKAAPRSSTGRTARPGKPPEFDKSGGKPSGKPGAPRKPRGPRK